MSTKVVVRWAFWHDGIADPPTSTIACEDELDAVRPLESGRSELHDPRDASKLNALALGELQKVMYRVGPPTGNPNYRGYPGRDDNSVRA